MTWPLHFGREAPWLILLLLAVAAALALREFWKAWPERRMTGQPSSRLVVLLTTRLLALLLLAGMLVEVGVEEVDELALRKRVAVLFDRSASMNTREKSEAPSRFERAETHWQEQAALLPHWRESGLAPDAHTFGDTLDALEGPLAELPADRPASRLGAALARILQIESGDMLTVEMRQGRQEVLDLPVVGIAETRMGAPAYMELTAMNRAIGEPGRVSGAYLRIDSTYAETLYEQLNDIPTIAGVSLKSDSREAFQRVMDTGAGAVRYVMALIAGVITFGVVYNAARIAYAERARDLASLRVVGFTRAEVSFVLLGELVVVTLLAIPIGAGFGFGLAWAVSQAFSNDIYQVSAYPDPSSIGTAAVAVLASAALSGWMVKRQIDKADLVLALKTRE